MNTLTLQSISSRLAFFLALAGGLLLLPQKFVQAQTPNGSLRGEVQDSNGGRVAAATIVVEARGSGWKREIGRAHV